MDILAADATFLRLVRFVAAAAFTAELYRQRARVVAHPEGIR
jgi:hypothetical protein